MKVIVAKTAGFCNGVRYALDVTLEAVKRRRPEEVICTYGPLIHNRQVLAMLREKGVQEVNTPEECAGKTVVIRAHGIPPNLRQNIYGVASNVINATCKRVAQVQAVIRQHARKGYHTVIVGDADHAEVIGLLGYAEGKGVAIQHPDDIDKLPDDWDRVLLVAQTTQNEEIFEEVVKRFKRKYPNGIVKKTICGATHERQEEVRQLARKVDAMVIVGGYHSGNTVRLAQVAAMEGVPTYHVETERDLNPQEMARYRTVGVSAGASTPQWMIENVVRFLETISHQRGSSKRLLREISRILVYSQTISFLTGFLSTFAVGLLLWKRPNILIACLAGLLCFAIQVFQRYLSYHGVLFNDPEWTSFLVRHRKCLIGMAIVLSMIFSGCVWLKPWALPGFILALAFGSALLIWEENLNSVPGLEYVAKSTTWTSLTVLMPFGRELFRNFLELVVVSCLAFIIFFIKHLIQDLLETRQDRLIGRKTLFSTWGLERTKRYLFAGMLCVILLLFLGPSLGVLTNAAYLFIIPIGGLAFCLRRFVGERTMVDTIMTDLIIDGSLVIPGLIGFLLL
ncbi:MAG: 4-hydroxy-3-methylbut-2-enyl diphosphate reductase [Syntrophobacterales bacterium]|nr:4-hydroxy-3-methylbut-2-enyl diphosphate reductase [Syntrophobacterales bacterium]